MSLPIHNMRDVGDTIIGTGSGTRKTRQTHDIGHKLNGVTYRPLLVIRQIPS